MIAPPRWIETLLASLGARAEYTEAVLGDMQEELALRAELDGPAPARRWYYGEALRSAPYLLRDWGRSAGVGSFIQLVAAAVLATTASVVIGDAIRTATVTYLGVVPDNLGIVGIAWRDVIHEYPVLGPMARIWDFSQLFLAGAVAARLYRRAPIVGALGIVAIGLFIDVVMVATGGEVPLTVVVAAAVQGTLKVVAGGLMVALGSRRSPVESNRSELVTTL